MKPNNAYVLGITGGIGSGKSLALSYLQNKYNCFVIKADDIGNDVKLKGNVCYDDIINLLGEDILKEDGEIDKNIIGLKNFAPVKDFAEEILNAKSFMGLAKTKYVNDKQITDHYAIVPTGQGLNSLNSVISPICIPY